MSAVAWGLLLLFVAFGGWRLLAFWRCSRHGHAWHKDDIGWWCTRCWKDFLR